MLDYTPAEPPQSCNLLSLSQDLIPNSFRNIEFCEMAHSWSRLLSGCIRSVLLSFWLFLSLLTCVRGIPSAPLNGVTSLTPSDVYIALPEWFPNASLALIFICNLYACDTCLNKLQLRSNMFLDMLVIILYSLIPDSTKLKIKRAHVTKHKK